MIKRSSAILLTVLLVLAGVSLFLFVKNKKTTTVNTDARDFKYKDTAAISKIFIADKEGNKSIIERTKKGWYVNNKYPCRSDAILNLLEVIRNVEVKMAVPKVSRDNVIKSLASGALKVEIYAGEDLVKQYYVGHETQDSEGSYMLLTNVETGKNFEEPFICFIPGFIGYLLPRYIANENDWRDRLVINYIPPQMKKITVEHLEQPDSSFTIDVLDSRTFRLMNKNGQELKFDDMRMKQYLAYFQNLSYEVLITGKDKKLQDSIYASKPFEIITVQTNQLSNNTYKFYHKAPKVKTTEAGNNFKHDPDRMYLRFDSDRELAVIQSYVFGKLLVNASYFTLPGNVKK